MGQVQVRDHAIWIRHIIDDPPLAQHLTRLAAGQTVRLKVSGHTGTWVKMRNSPGGAPTPGLRPLTEMAQVWETIYKNQRHEYVPIALDEPAEAHDVEKSQGLGETPSLNAHRPSSSPMGSPITSPDPSASSSAAPASESTGTARTWREASDSEGDAAWAAFVALTRAGWRSEGPELTREDLHGRSE